MTRFFTAALIFLVLLAFLVGENPPGLFFKEWVLFPSVFLLRVQSYLMSDLFQLYRAPSLVEENRLLKKRLMHLEAEEALLKETVADFKRKEAFLDFQKSHPEKRGIFCRIIGRDPAHWSQTVFLDCGLKDGVSPGTALIGTRGLVGQIAEAKGSWSKALLITDADSKVGAILERSRELGLLTGSPRGLLTLEYLSPGADVREGDKVLTAGFGETFPKGILIGEVIGFGTREETPLMYALVRPAESLTQLEEVLCVSK